MTLARKVAANTTYQIAGKLVASAFAFLSTLLLTRYLGANHYGLFVTAGVYYVFFETFTDFGLSQVLVRMSALHPERVPEILSKAMTLKFLIGVGLFLVCTAVGTLAFGRPGQEVLRQGAVLLALTFFVTWLTGTYAAYFQYVVRHQVLALATVFAKCAALVVILLFIQRRLGLLPFFTINALSWLVALGVLLYFVRREGLRLRFAVDGALWRELLVQSAPLGLVVLLNVLYLKADLMLLAAFRPPAEVGAYGLAYTVIDFAMAPAGFFMVTLYPTMAARSEDPRHIELLLARAMRVLLVLGFGVFVVAFSCAQHLVLLLGGQAFVIAVLPLQILTVAVLISYFNAALGHTIIATGHQRALIRTVLIVLATNLAANLVLIPRWGLRGAAASMILSEGLSLALLVRSIGALGIRVTFPHLGRLLLAGALLIAAVLPWYRHVVFPDLPRNALALALGAAAIGSSYLLIVRALRIFDARMEWDRLR